MNGGARPSPPPRWRPLVAHSYRIGAAWAGGAARRRDPRYAREGLYRLLVPLEPWRFYELGRLAGEAFAGDCLDVSSPKLLASLLQREGRGRWTSVDLLPEEVDLWRALDPGLDLRVEDARALSFGDAAFDAVACASVIEHVEGDGDAAAMAEMWRVLRPGGVLHLTTNVAARAHDVLTERPVYGGAEAATGRHFFERRYSARTLRERLLGESWTVEREECVIERRPVHERFFNLRPASFAAGGLLRLVCPGNFAVVGGPDEVPEGRHGVAYLRLRKPG
jgi:SAM-dependent methyltransferase